MARQFTPDPVQLADLTIYEQARQQLANFSAPVLADAAHPNRKVFVAAFDGTLVRHAATQTFLIAAQAGLR